MDYKEKLKFDETEEYLWVNLKNPENEDSVVFNALRTWIYNLGICVLLISGAYWKVLPVIVVGIGLVTWNAFQSIRRKKQMNNWNKKYKSMVQKVEEVIEGNSKL